MCFFYYECVKKETLKLVAKECALLIVQIIFSNIRLFGFSSGAGLAFAFARLFLGSNLIVVVSFFVVSKLILIEKITGLIVIAYEVVLLSLYYFSKEFVRSKKQVFLSVVFILFANLLELYFSLSSWAEAGKCLVSLVSCVFVFVFLIIFCKACKNKFVFFRVSESDYLMFSLMILLLVLGVFGFSIIENYAGYFLIVFVAMTFSKVLPADKFFVSLLILAVGALLATQKLDFLVFAVLVSVIFIQFADMGKYIFSLICAICLVGLIFALKSFDVVSIVSIFLSVICFLLIPQKTLIFFKTLFVFDGQNIIFQKVQEKKIADVKNKLLLMSSTFAKMQRDFKFLLVGKIDREKASFELSQDVINKCCLVCENYRTCYMENINKRRMFEGLMLKAIENRGVTLSDMPSGAESYCSKSAIVTSEINQTAKMFLSFEKAMKNEDSSKLMIASELGNFSDIFKNFAFGLKQDLKPNFQMSKAIKEKLLNFMVDIKEVLLFENENGIEDVVLILPNNQVLKREVAECLTKVTKNKLKLSSVCHLSESGLAYASFVVESKIRVEFAVSTKAKEQKNGDNVIVSKLSEKRFFVALADGMGHGKEAHKISSMVLSLVRSMFEVGLDDNLIAESVNKLLIPAGLDNFSTLDACVIDTELGVCNFIKMGSSVSILKRKQTSEIVSCKSLPIGIVQNARPTIIRKQISAGDMIFLASDGVVDSYASINDFKSFVNDAKIYNLQKFTDDVIFDGQGIAAKHIDDMTIIGINLLKK